MILKRNTLSRRIQEKILGNDLPYASNLCNHFWLTLFAISVVTVFLPITLLGYLFVVVVEWFSKRKSIKRDRWIEQGKKLTLKQAFSLMINEGFIRRKYPDYYISPYENYSTSQRKSGFLLDGWKKANEDWEYLIKAHVKMVKANFKPVSVKAVAIKTRTAIVSYIPTTYATLAIGVTLLAGMILGGLCLSDIVYDGEGWVRAIIIGCFMFFIGAVIPAMIFSAFWFGVENSYGPLQRFTDKYGEPLEDDVFISFLKSVKNKMCPLIEWTDEE